VTNDEERKRAELLAKARQQLAQATEEFQRGLAAVKDPARRKNLTLAYVQLMQKYLAKAQQSLDRYREKREGVTSANQAEDMPQP
jgi:hypothetical protein